MGKGDWWQAHREDIERSERETKARARGEFAQWIAGAYEWHYFGGLTFDQRRVPQERLWGDTWVPRRISRDVAVARAKRFMRQAEKALGRRLVMVVALEAHRNGWPHFHPLIHVEGGRRRGDLQTIGPVWYELNGYEHLELRFPEQAARYCGKYMVKDDGVEVLFSENFGRGGPEGCSGQEKGV